jgi:hypothetical protein
MVSCNEMKLGQVYTCPECGLELEVVQECKECGEEESECSIEDCTFKCCGEEMVLKE